MRDTRLGTTIWKAIRTIHYCTQCWYMHNLFYLGIQKNNIDKTSRDNIKVDTNYIYPVVIKKNYFVKIIICHKFNNDRIVYKLTLLKTSNKNCV